jgi:hypothetical protein
MHRSLPVAADVEEGGALGRTDPLVEVRRIVRSVERVEVERNHAGGMRAVDERIDSAIREGAHDPGNRDDECGRARYVADHREARPIGRRVEQPRDDVVLGYGRERQPRDDDARAVARGHMSGDVQDRVVLVVGGEDLVAGLEPERPQDRVHAAGGVRDQPEVIGVRPDERADRRPDLGERPVELSGQELDRLALEPVAPRPLSVEDRRRTCAIRPVVEKCDLRVEAPVAGKGRRHARMMAGRLADRWVPSTRWIRSSSC